MTESSVYDQFNGYHAYPLGAGERMVREKLVKLFEKIIGKNEICLVKAQEKGLEKLTSRILAVKKRMDRMRNDMARTEPGTAYKFEPLSAADEETLKEIDGRLESVIQQCFAGIESLTCMETDMHISDRFAMMDDSLREIEALFHKRAEVFKKMRIYG
ncbi:MAG: hypothetical protein JW807_12130 [Spirochaetes bacterium]|nr:hypothetical protein [Spirochaetota bacterium]